MRWDTSLLNRPNGSLLPSRNRLLTPADASRWRQTPPDGTRQRKMPLELALIAVPALTIWCLLLLAALAVAVRSAARWRRAADAWRATALRTPRQPQLTRHLPALPDAGDPLPRFRLTALDGRVDPDGVWRPPPL